MEREKKRERNVYEMRIEKYFNLSSVNLGASIFHATNVRLFCQKLRGFWTL